MLWNAGQKRIVRENRDRLVDLYIAIRDGYVSGNVVTGKVKARSDVTPAYARRPSAKPEPIDELRDRDKVFADLMRQFPGVVRRADS